MDKTHYTPTETEAWARLQQLAASLAALPPRELLSEPPDRAEHYNADACGIHLDYARQRVDDRVLAQLLALAEASPLADQIEELFTGGIVNTTEQRPALHTLLRCGAEHAPPELAIPAAEVEEQRSALCEMAENIRQGVWRGVTGKAITDVVNIGIGGSELGPRTVCTALQEYAGTGPECHFLANVDGAETKRLLNGLDPATTLVVVVSKTFTTLETLQNGRTAAHWLECALSLSNAFESPHIVAVTAEPQRAAEMGVAASRILEFREWVGGRYSLWSAVGLSIALHAGAAVFNRLLAGAAAMDTHFRNTPWERNLPVLMALLGIWNNNFLGAGSLAVVPYCERLHSLPGHLQQLEMESNGKSVTLDGETVGWSTGPLVWGATGTNAQHSFFQLLHQGTPLVAVDFIGLESDPLSVPEHHRVLLASMLAQAAALMEGHDASGEPPYRHHAGGRPSSILLLETLTPETLGALLALYEHKVFVQGVIWHIDPFDQWGVELGKELARGLLDGSGEPDATTRRLWRRLDETGREDDRA